MAGLDCIKILFVVKKKTGVGGHLLGLGVYSGAVKGVSQNEVIRFVHPGETQHGLLSSLYTP